MAEAFCTAKPALNPQLNRYGRFFELEQQGENSIDFKVQTEIGPKWIELAEFAPLTYYNAMYENVPIAFSVEESKALFQELIEHKSQKSYRSDVILLIHKTHNALSVPPPIIRSVRKELENSPPPFEAIYYISADSVDHAATWQVWPNDLRDEGPVFNTGNIKVGID